MEIARGTNSLNLRISFDFIDRKFEVEMRSEEILSFLHHIDRISRPNGKRSLRELIIFWNYHEIDNANKKERELSTYYRSIFRVDRQLAPPPVRTVSKVLRSEPEVPFTEPDVIPAHYRLRVCAIQADQETLSGDLQTSRKREEEVFRVARRLSFLALSFPRLLQIDGANCNQTLRNLEGAILTTADCKRNIERWVSRRRRSLASCRRKWDKIADISRAARERSACETSPDKLSLNRPVPVCLLFTRARALAHALTHVCMSVSRLYVSATR